MTELEVNYLHIYQKELERLKNELLSLQRLPNICLTAKLEDVEQFEKAMAELKAVLETIPLKAKQNKTKSRA